jgi:hypothetical protein
MCELLHTRAKVSSIVTAPMMKIAFIAAAAVAVLTTTPVTTPAKAQGIEAAGVEPFPPRFPGPAQCRNSFRA